MAEDSNAAPPFRRRVPDGDDRERLVCDSCGFIHYENPKIVVGSVARWGDRLLLCRRAIEPRRGYWTIPAGYMELAETSEEGARREAWEEARADLALDGLLAVYNIARISQVQLIYLARLTSEAVAAGPESAEVALVGWDDIPWDELAFPSVVWALQDYRRLLDRPGGLTGDFAPFGNPPGDRGDRRPAGL
ncbi:NUDIX hydrolase [Rhodothalassium salexigens]|uniref:NUDIX hydrolase n=1 Tax=Rhodothalassium salexigens TaxID=1086 RepID=UPI0019144AF7|nr:NUDIX hydrolase [Rhodothalassium salexigens]MBK5910452.1 NUDIX hydrolase [Rhodothalassium salexigens]MBK5921730.1 NUDIX hydrolase [Rhodothalassium salexigens]